MTIIAPAPISTSRAAGELLALERAQTQFEAYRTAAQTERDSRGSMTLQMGTSLQGIGDEYQKAFRNACARHEDGANIRLFAHYGNRFAIYLQNLSDEQAFDVRHIERTSTMALDLADMEFVASALGYYTPTVDEWRASIASTDERAPIAFPVWHKLFQKSDATALPVGEWFASHRT